MAGLESTGGSVWAPYGLRSNPFFTAPLDPEQNVKHGIQLFRGRQREEDAARIVRRILNDDNSVTLIEGPSGIGKTTLANLVKNRLAAAADCAVFPGTVQVDVRGPASVQSFIADLMHATLVALRRSPRGAEVASEVAEEAEGLILDALVERRAREWSLRKVLGVKWTRSFFLRQADQRPVGEWVEALQNIRAIAASEGVGRIVVHVNNLDQSTITDADAVGHFFGHVRDTLQTDGFHFLLCANEQFRLRALDNRPNVTDILGTPVMPAPLSPEDIAEIVQARYEDARAPGGGVSFTPPIEPEDAAQLFVFFEGELRAAFEMLGQTFMQELGPTGRALTLRVPDVVDVQTPLIQRMLSALSENQMLVLAAVAECTRKRAEVRQNELVDFIHKTLDDPPSQSHISKIAISLSQEHWLARRQQNLRMTMYSLGGRAKMVRPVLLSQLAVFKAPRERRLTDFVE